MLNIKVWNQSNSKRPADWGQALGPRGCVKFESLPDFTLRVSGPYLYIQWNLWISYQFCAICVWSYVSKTYVFVTNGVQIRASDMNIPPNYKNVCSRSLGT